MFSATDLSSFPLLDEDFDFTSTNAPSVSVVPADTMGGQDTANSYGDSPASSAGMDNDRRSPSPMLSHHSRASSLASSHGSPSNHYSHLGDSSNPSANNNTYDQSNSNHPWGIVTAPSPPPSAQSPSATGGSRSPPALLIPDHQQSSHLNVTPGTGGLFPPGPRNPAVGIPGGNLSIDGPGINLIPATPVSGGGNGATTAPFGTHFGPNANPGAGAEGQIQNQNQNAENGLKRASGEFLQF